MQRASASRQDWPEYLSWAVAAFRLASSGATDETQIHTHMCYAEFQDIIGAIAMFDADVISIETARSQMELLRTFSDSRYPNEIGPGIWDIHSPRGPDVTEIVALLDRALEAINTRAALGESGLRAQDHGWDEVEQALQNLPRLLTACGSVSPPGNAGAVSLVDFACSIRTWSSGPGSGTRCESCAGLEDEADPAFEGVADSADVEHRARSFVCA